MSAGGFNSRPSEGIWHSLNRFVLTLIVCAATVPIAYSFMPEVKKRKEQDARIEELKGAVEQQRMRVARHQREVELLTRDPEYVGLIARDLLGLMKEGETIYRLDPPKPNPATMKRNR